MASDLILIFAIDVLLLVSDTRVLGRAFASNLLDDDCNPNFKQHGSVDARSRYGPANRRCHQPALWKPVGGRCSAELGSFNRDGGLHRHGRTANDFDLYPGAQTTKVRVATTQSTKRL